MWAAGNVVDPRAQLITAAGAGSAAAIAINADLVLEDVQESVATRTVDIQPPDNDAPRPLPSSGLTPIVLVLVATVLMLLGRTHIGIRHGRAIQ